MEQVREIEQTTLKDVRAEKKAEKQIAALVIGNHSLEQIHGNASAFVELGNRHRKPRARAATAALAGIRALEADLGAERAEQVVEDHRCAEELPSGNAAEHTARARRGKTRTAHTRKDRQYQVNLGCLRAETGE